MCLLFYGAYIMYDGEFLSVNLASFHTKNHLCQCHLNMISFPSLQLGIWVNVCLVMVANAKQLPITFSPDGAS